MGKCAYKSIVFYKCGLINLILYHLLNSHPYSGMLSYETVYSNSQSVGMF